MSDAEKSEKKPNICPKCGAKNRSAAKFCDSCGARLLVESKGGFEALASLNLVAALYVLLSAAFNEIIRAAPIFLALYLSAGILGLGVAYQMSAGKVGRWTKFLSLAIVILGLAGTIILFLIGLGIRGVVGPGWVIFLILAWRLWQDRRSL
jgi:ribosomal protein L40E